MTNDIETGAARLTALCRAAGLANRADEVVARFRRSATSQFDIWSLHGPRGAEVGFSVEGSDSPLASLFPKQPRTLVAYGASGAPRVSIRFDAQAQGRWHAWSAVEELLVKLDLPRAWPEAVAHIRGIEHDQLLWLEVAADGAVEVAWRHSQIAAADTINPDLCRSLLGGEGPFSQLVSRVIFHGAQSSEARRVLELPLAGSEGRANLQPPERYAGALERLADDPVRTLIASGGERFIRCSYTAVESEPERKLEEADEIVRRYENDIVLANHPFLARMRREPVNLGNLWVVLANFWEAIVHDFPARLARVIVHLDDDRLRSVFVKQLNDELGEGDYERAHKPMFQRLLNAVVPYRPQGDDDKILQPGRRFGAALERLLFAPDYHVALGALMMIEVYGKQTDVRMGEEFRRQQQLGGNSLEWLHLHEELEVDHADDSLRLAKMMPRLAEGPEARAKLQAVWRGAMGVVDAGHAYFNDLYRVCY